MKLARPVKKSLLSQGFGVSGTQEYLIPLYNKYGLKAHNGWDWVTKSGSEVRFEALDCYGKVTHTISDESFGNYVIIITEDKDGCFKHIYGHLKSFSCKPGDILQSGDLIGLADNTGVSTGSHLHRGLKEAVLKGSIYITKNKDNGYNGAIDIAPYYKKNIYIKDYIDILQGQISILKKLIKLFKGLLLINK